MRGAVLRVFDPVFLRWPKKDGCVDLGGGIGYKQVPYRSPVPARIRGRASEVFVVEAM